MQTLTLNNTSRFSISENQINTQLEQDTVILNIATGKYFSLTGVASFIWKYIQEGKSFQEIHEQVMQNYAVTTEQSLEDLTTFITNMHQAGLIQPN